MEKQSEQGEQGHKVKSRSQRQREETKGRDREKIKRKTTMRQRKEAGLRDTGKRRTEQTEESDRIE